MRFESKGSILKDEQTTFWKSQFFFLFFSPFFFFYMCLIHLLKIELLILLNFHVLQVSNYFIQIYLFHIFQVVGYAHCFYELRSMRPKLHKLHRLLEDTPYKGEMYEEETDKTHMYSMEQLKSRIQASEAEIMAELRKVKACCIKGNSCLSLSLLHSHRPIGQHTYICFFSLAWAFCLSLVPSGPKCVSTQSDWLNKQTNSRDNFL